MQMKSRPPKKLDNPLAFDNYDRQTRHRRYRIPQKADKTNCLLAQTDNFFVMAGTGSFTPGYVLILPKEEYTSFGAIPKELDEEARWLIHQISLMLREKYGVQPMHFEHGKAHFTSGNDHAHYHLLPTSAAITSEQFTKAINDTLEARACGITAVIQPDGSRITNPEDIKAIFPLLKDTADNYEGQLLKYDDVKRTDYSHSILQLARNFVNDGKHYTYLRAPDQRITVMVGGINLQSQFCREVIARAMTMAGQNHSQTWDYRQHHHYDNMQQTMKDLADPMTKLSGQASIGKSEEGRRYGFRTAVYPDHILDRINTGSSTGRNR
jgi:diadenosine tetraphosphate (Ap4A) HIT family hydrolase